MLSGHPHFIGQIFFVPEASLQTSTRKLRIFHPYQIIHTSLKILFDFNISKFIIDIVTLRDDKIIFIIDKIVHFLYLYYRYLTQKRPIR